jgi:glycosyltransferase involved in cell wall biosynthesis
MLDDISYSLTREERAILDAQQEPFFLCAGALVPYKRLDVAVDACNQLQMPLWIVGKGPERAALEERAGSSIRFFGHVSEAFLWECYKRCRALLFPGIEDFGIIPIECLSSGRPVIAIQAGGVSESVDGILVGASLPQVSDRRASGVFVPKSGFGSSQAFAAAICYFSQIESTFDVESLRRNAQRFEYREFFRAWAAFARNAGIPAGCQIPLQSGQKVGERDPISVSS